jgi:hypothetical protein
VKVQIEQSRLNELLDKEAQLDALEAGGVDNWEWYDEALKEGRDRHRGIFSFMEPRSQDRT